MLAVVWLRVSPSGGTQPRRAPETQYGPLSRTAAGQEAFTRMGHVLQQWSLVRVPVDGLEGGPQRVFRGCNELACIMPAGVGCFCLVSTRPARHE